MKIQTRDVILYNIKPFNDKIPPITVIDTPGFGDTGGLAKDKLISEKIVISNPEKIREIILTMNMHQERQISMIADKIAEKVFSGKVKFIGIAGPSASGKTTFSKKLGTCLKSKGIEPVVLSMDDYYKDNKDAPTDETGNKDNSNS